MPKKSQESAKPQQGQKEYTRRWFSGWTMDEEKRQRLVKVIGLILTVFTVFTLLSLVSYLFTWEQDQSLMHEGSMISTDVSVSNWAGKWGWVWSSFLISKCFGLGSFFLVIMLIFGSVYLLIGKKAYGFWKTILLTLSAAILSSIVLGFVGFVAGNNTAFGGGLGGECGDFLAVWMSNLIGPIVTFLTLSVLAIIWLISVSSTFAHWLVKIGTSKPKKEDSSSSEESSEELSKESSKVSSEPDVPQEPFIDQTAASDNQAKAADIPDYGDTPEMVDLPELNDMPESSDAPQSDINMDMNQARALFEQIGAVDADDKDVTIDNTAKPSTVEPSTEVDKFQGFDTQNVAELPRINVRDELSNYEFPSISLLDDYAEYQFDISKEEQEANKQRVLEALKIYHIEVTDIKVIQGPTITLYKIYIAPGVRINLIKNIEGELGIALKAEQRVRVVLLPDSVGIEVPNEKSSTVPLKAMLDDPAFRSSKAELPVAIGYTISKEVRIFDLAKAPHLLVAGATQQGKSVGLNVIVSSLLYAKHPSELKFVFIDPKMVEFSAYRELYKHYLAVLPTAANDEDEKFHSVVTDQKSANDILKSLCIEMDQRYDLLNRGGVNNIKSYNEKWKNRHLLPTEGHHFLPYIVTVIDEFADLTMATGMGGESRKNAISLKESIIRLAQKGRAAGIHVILATQRPEAQVVSGLIKSNCPLKIAFKVANSVDSKVVIGGPGAEKLIGRGDMLLCSGVDKERVQCAMVSMDEITRITKFIGSQTTFKACYTTPYYLPIPESDAESGAGDVDMSKLDEHFVEAARMIVQNQRGSTSDLQRRLGVGYARAGKLMDQLEAAGIVGPQSGSRPREVYVNDMDELDQILEVYMK